ncbi:MAG: 50S ribosomal protein L9 [Pseudomonadota bacterium]|nr:50S ribosomal protein L9 [Pseudomonadota bacterium]
MKVILLENVSNLGEMGAEVNVKDGYARNFLIPRMLAVICNRKNQAQNTHRKRMLERKLNKQLSIAHTKAEALAKLTIAIPKQVGEEERIFGTVTTAEIEKIITDNGIEVARKDIHLTTDIKKLGDYEAEVKLHPKLTTTLKFAVIPLAQETQE